MECYQKLRPLDAKGGLWMVRDSVTEQVYVMRKLHMSSQKVCQVLTGIDHPHIVKVCDTFIYEGFLYVVEEYIEGKTLAEVMETEKPSSRWAVFIGCQLLEALAVLHAHQIIHRDVKPENIMIDEAGDVKLIDLELARMDAKGKRGDTTVKGTRDYAPPEQYGFAQSDCRVDIYAAGVTLNVLAVGKLPNEKICGGRLGRIITRCVQFDPSRRYQTAEQVERQLKRLEHGRAFWGVAVGAAVVLTAAAAFFLAAESGRQADVKAPASQEETALPSAEEDEGGSPDEDGEQSDEPGGADTFEALAENMEWQDRIIKFDVRDQDHVPFFLPEEGQTYSFTEAVGEDLYTDASVRKEKETLTFSCAVQGREEAVFTFEDDEMYDTGMLAAYHPSITTDECAVDYEVALYDIDHNGTKDFLISMSRRKRIDTPFAEDRYYLKEYAVTWVVFIDEGSKYSCSDPVFFCVLPQYRPEIVQTAPQESIFYEDIAEDVYMFGDGRWKNISLY